MNDDLYTRLSARAVVLAMTIRAGAAQDRELVLEDLETQLSQMHFMLDDLRGDLYAEQQTTDGKQSPQDPQMEIDYEL